jgi:hypothetical protein
VDVVDKVTEEGVVVAVAMVVAVVALALIRTIYHNASCAAR